MVRIVKKINLIIFLVLIGILLKSVVFAKGNTSASFLKVGISPRIISMGGLKTVIIDDVSAIEGNPACLTQSMSKQLSFAHNEWIEGIKGEYLAFINPTTFHSAWGLNLYYSDLGTMIKRDENGDVTGSFTAQNALASIGYSRLVSENFSIGLKVKGIYESLDENNDIGYAADIGLLISHKQIRIGAYVENLGKGIKLYKEEFPLPTRVNVGVLFNTREDISFGVDVINDFSDEEVSINTGAEYVLAGKLAIRGGYQFNRAENTGLGFTAGMGLNIGLVTLDYAYIPFGDLGNTHRAAIKFKFD
ncbi:PorV/PorQ family protein [bacterium]